MISSFGELNLFWQNNYFNPGLIILKSKSPETRSNLFLDLILNQCQKGKVYICCASKYMLEDKIGALQVKNKHNIHFIEVGRDLGNHYNGTFFFYEPSYIWMPKIQSLIYNNKKVVVNYSERENFYYNKFGLFQEIDIEEERGSFKFKIREGDSEPKTLTAIKPLKYVQFSYYLESAGLKTLFEKFFQSSFNSKQIIIKNYFPDSLDIFTCDLRFLLGEHGIKSQKFFDRIRSKSLIVTDTVIEINCIYIHLCLNLLKVNPAIKIDSLYKIISCNLDECQLRRSYYKFFKYFKEEKLVKLIMKSDNHDFCYLESIEMDFELLRNKNPELLNMVPRKIQTFLELKDFTSKITYKYQENKPFPRNLFHACGHKNVFVPTNFFELYELKLYFRNCVSIYLNDILENKKVILKVNANNKNFCVSLDAKKFEILSIKLAANKEPSAQDFLIVKEIIGNILKSQGVKQTILERISHWFLNLF